MGQKVGEFGLKADIAYIDINPSKYRRFGSPDTQSSYLSEMQQQLVVRLNSEMQLTYNTNTPTIQQAEVIDMLSELQDTLTRFLESKGHSPRRL